MRRFTSIILAALLLFSLTACKKNTFRTHLFGEMYAMDEVLADHRLLSEEIGGGGGWVLYGGSTEPTITETAVRGDIQGFSGTIPLYDLEAGDYPLGTFIYDFYGDVKGTLVLAVVDLSTGRVLSSAPLEDGMRTHVYLDSSSGAVRVALVGDNATAKFTIDGLDFDAATVKVY